MTLIQCVAVVLARNEIASYALLMQRWRTFYNLTVESLLWLYLYLGDQIPL